MTEKIIAYLSTNYRGDDTVIDKYIEDYSAIASHSSNRTIDDEKLIPYIVEAVVSAYLRRGDEGSSSSTEGSLSTTYVDIEQKLAKDVRAIRKLNI